MIGKKDIIDLLKSMKNDENKNKIEQYIEKVSKVDEKTLEILLENNEIKTLQDAQRFITSAMKSERNDEFTNLNDLISYSFVNNSISLHVVPKDARFLLSKRGLEKSEYLLIDALEKIQVMLQENEGFESVKQVYAVSGLIRMPISTLFENLDFDVKSMKNKLAKKDIELSKFYEMFKDKKYIGRAVLSKEKLLSDEWNRHKNQRKEQLLMKKVVNIDSEEIINTNFRKDLGQVYSQNEIAINTKKREETENQKDNKEITNENKEII